MKESDGAVRVSYCMLPDYPLSDCIEMIKVADELGFYACYSVDETWHKDLWCLFAAAAGQTRQIRLGPNVTHVFLREPTLICQQLATLDELSGGRAEAVVSTGNFVMMDQYHLDWAKRRPLSRLREAMQVMRTFLDEGKLDFDGEFFKYTGLFTAARPVQERIPLKLGGMKGPRSFEVAGEIADGLHHALSYSRDAYDYVVDHVKLGAQRCGRDWHDLDLGAWIVSVVSEDSAAAKRAARILVAFYIPSMPPEQLARHGIDPAELKPMFDAFAAGDVAGAIDMFTPELAERLSVAGTPEECAEQIRRDILPAGINHVILALADSHLVQFFSGQGVEGVPSIPDQLRLTAQRIVPALG
ncbi:MAG: LLM class flavin-dependent oxidoreductase [Mycobacteriales bacterium]